jgi:hypothetical protein
MPQTTMERPLALVTTSGNTSPDQDPSARESERRGFGGNTGAAKGRVGKGGANKGSGNKGSASKGGAGKGGAGKGGKKRSPGLSKGDWGPLGKHPDLDAIVARQRLHLPLSGRLTAAEVNQAWKRCASEHHPDRGGEHDTMQLVNGARDLLLGRDLGSG